MIQIIEEINNWINAYFGDSYILPFGFFSFIYLFAYHRDIRRKLLIPMVALVVVVFNPVLYNFFYYKIVYWRLIWAFPYVFLIAIAFVKIATLNNDNKKLNIFFMILLICFVCLKGVFVYNKETFSKIENEYKLSNSTISVCDYILEQSDHPRCIMPSPLTYEARQYSGDIELMFGRDVEGYIASSDEISKKLYNELMSDNMDSYFVFSNGWFENYEYIVIQKDKYVDQDVLEEFGYRLKKIIDNYAIYYADLTIRQMAWRVTQFSQSQYGAAYILENVNGELVIIDGGYNWEADRLYDVIADHNGEVEAWIITNPHSEHVNAFNEMYRKHKDIKVNRIYTINIDLEKYNNQKKEYERFEDCKTFTDILASLDNVTYVNSGDVIQLNGIELDILNAWDDSTEKISDAICYNGSMCIIASAQNDSMLFLSDLLNASGNYIVSQCADINKIKYLQVSNHGSWGMSTEIYDKFSPRKVFFDSTEDVLNPENSSNNSWILRNYFEERGIMDYNNSTTPNSVILK